VAYLREWFVELEGWRRTGDTALASWILPRLTQPPGAVCGSAPDGFPAYARICHPVPNVSGHSLTWRAVAEVTGTVAHPLMQWHALIGAVDPYARSSARWHGEAPAWGHLDGAASQRLSAALQPHTRTTEDSICAYWVGYTPATDGTVTAVWTGATGDTAPGPAAPLDPSEPPLCSPTPPLVAEAPDTLGVVHLPGRDYELFTCPLVAMLGRGRSRQSPQLLWPADRAWCVATEIDFDSTLVAGDQALIDDLLSSPGLDAWAVLPTDSLRHDADLINGR